MSLFYSVKDKYYLKPTKKTNVIYQRKVLVLACFLASTLMLSRCGEEKTADAREEAAAEVADNKPMEFVSHRVVDNAKWWWALTIGDVTGDGFQDIVYINNNANGGYLGFRTGSKSGELWAETIVAQAPPTGGTFAAGDLEVGDMDGDGDLDILAVKHTGERDDPGAEAEIYYYKNPEWIPHAIGKAKDAVKDLSIGDFNGDGRMDLAVLTCEENNLRIHQQFSDGSFRKVQDITREGLHEGMDLGDMNQDGRLDVVANGFVFLNPGDNLGDPWMVETVDPKWNTQTGDWSANGTKTFFKVFEGAPTIFMTHSERGGYPLAKYTRSTDGTYNETIILDELPAAHTLQVFDMDLDGDDDIVTGINFARAVNLDPKVDHFEVLVLVNEGNNKWTRKQIDNEGIYNGRVADFEGDGDYDLFRYPDHEATDLFWVENLVR